MTQFRVGCAGWTIPKEHASFFKPEGTHLERYASCFDCVEINSSFYRPHRPATYARWAASVPDHFCFAIKAPKTITHQRKLVDTGPLLDAFLAEISALGPKCGPLLFQLPPSLQFNHNIAQHFFDSVRLQYSKAVVCEPRHSSWFTSQASDLLTSFRISRVAADPSYVTTIEAAGCTGTVYFRLHGSPRMYYSNYTRDVLNSLIDQFRAYRDAESVWCIFDNTAAGCAVENAHYVTNQLREIAAQSESLACPQAAGERSIAASG